MRRNSEPENQNQADKFKQLARDLECNDDEKRFEEAVKKVSKAKPSKPADHKPTGE